MKKALAVTLLLSSLACSAADTYDKENFSIHGVKLGMTGMAARDALAEHLKIKKTEVLSTSQAGRLTALYSRRPDEGVRASDKSNERPLTIVNFTKSVNPRVYEVYLSLPGNLTRADWQGIAEQQTEKHGQPTIYKADDNIKASWCDKSGIGLDKSFCKAGGFRIQYSKSGMENSYIRLRDLELKTKLEAESEATKTKPINF